MSAVLVQALLESACAAGKGREGRAGCWEKTAEDRVMQQRQDL